MKACVAFVALLTLLAGSVDARHTQSRRSLLGAPQQLLGNFFHSRHLSVDYRGSDTRGSDPYGNGGQAASKPFAAQAPTAVSMSAGAPSLAQAASMSSSQGSMTPQTADIMPYTAMGGMGDAPMSAPAGESAPSVTGRRLTVDTRGSDPVGADTRGSDPTGSGASSSQPYAHPTYSQATLAPEAAPGSAGGPVPLSTVLYSSVPRVGSSAVDSANAPTTAPGATSAPAMP